MVIGVLIGFISWSILAYIYGPILAPVFGWDQSTVVWINMATIIFISWVLVRFVTGLILLTIPLILSRFSSILATITFILSIILIPGVSYYLFFSLMNYLFDNFTSIESYLCSAIFVDINFTSIESYLCSAIFVDIILLSVLGLAIKEYYDFDDLLSLVFVQLLLSLFFSFLVLFLYLLSLNISFSQYITTKYPFITTVPLIILILFAIIGYLIAKEVYENIYTSIQITVEKYIRKVRYWIENIYTSVKNLITAPLIIVKNVYTSVKNWIMGRKRKKEKFEREKREIIKELKKLIGEYDDEDD